MKYVLILLLLIAASCGGDSRQDVPTPLPTHTPTVIVSVTDGKSLQQLKEERDKLAMELEVLTSYIKKQEQDKIETISKWIAWSTFILAFVALAVSIFASSYPFLPTIMRYVSYGLFSISALAFTVPFIYMYILPVSLVLVFGALATSVYFHVRDRTTLRKVVDTVEKVKHEIPNYKSKLRSGIDAQADKWVNRIRKV